MRITREVGTATFIQFAAVSLLNVATAAEAIVQSCTAENQSCGDGVISSVAYYMMLVMWFGLVSVIGYGAQQTRNRKTVLLLIGAESLIALVAFWNLKNHPSILGLITSAVNLVLALLVIYLAFKLLSSGGRRIVARKRIRNRSSAKRR